MFYLIKNNFKLFKKYKFHYIIISLILSISVSLFIGILSSTIHQKNYIDNNAKTTRLEDIAFQSNYQLYTNGTNSKFTVTSNDSINSDFLNDFRTLYLSKKDTRLANLKYQIQKFFSFETFFPYSYDTNNTGGVDFGNEIFTFLNEPYVPNNINYKNNAISQPNTLGKRLPNFDGTYRYVYVSKKWAEKHNLRIGSSFSLYDNKFKIYNYINSAFYSSPVSLSWYFGSTDRNPFIILNPNDLTDIYENNRILNIINNSTFELLKFNKKISDSDINTYANDLWNFAVKINHSDYKNNIHDDSLTYFNPYQILHNWWFFSYNSRDFVVTVRYALFQIYYGAEIAINSVLIILILAISLVIFSIIIKQILEKDRYKIGLLKASGYKNFHISFAWIGSTFLLSLVTFLFSIPGVFLIINFDNKILSPMYLVNITPVPVDYYLYFTIFGFFIIVFIFSWLFSMFTCRENALMLLHQKKKFILGYISSRLLKIFSFFPLTLRFSISSFVASGFRSVLFVMIILGSSIFILIAIFINQMMLNTYKFLSLPYNANYYYSNNNYIPTNNSENYFGNFNLISIKGNNFAKEEEDFYKNNATKVQLNFDYKDNKINNVSENNLELLADYFSNRDYFSSKYQSFINNEHSYLGFNSILINGNNISNYKGGDFSKISKGISDYIRTKYNVDVKAYQIYMFFNKLSNYYSYAGNNAKINLGFQLINNNNDLQFLNKMIFLNNNSDNRDYYVPDNVSAYDNDGKLFSFPFKTDNNLKSYKATGGDYVNTIMINSNSDNYKEYFNNLNLNYFNNNHYTNTMLDHYYIPITISSKFANSFNLKIGSTFNNGLCNLLKQCSYSYENVTSYPSSTDSDNMKYNKNFSYGESFINSFYALMKKNNIEPKFYVSSIINQNQFEIFSSKNYINKYLDNIYNKALNSPTKKYMVNKNFFPSKNSPLWNNVELQNNSLLSKSDFSYTLNKNIPQLPIYSTSSLQFDSSLDKYYKYGNKKDAPDNEINYGDIGTDIRFWNDTYTNQLSLFNQLFIMIFIVVILISIMVIFVLSLVLVEENYNSIALLKLFGYKSNSISFMYLIINLPIIIFSYLISTLIVYEIIEKLTSILTNKVGFDFINEPNYLYILLGLIAFIVLYFMSLFAVRHSIMKISVRSLNKDI